MISDTDELADEVKVDGTAIEELTREYLVSKYGEPDTTEENTATGETDIGWENHGYYFNAGLNKDGKISYAESSYGQH